MNKKILTKKILKKITCLQKCEVLGLKSFKKKEEMKLTESKKDQSLGNQLIASKLFEGEYYKENITLIKKEGV